MTEKSPSPRPGLVTVACWMAVVASVLMVVSLFEAVAALDTVDVRDAVQQFLASPGGKGLALDPAGFIAFLRGLMLFAGATSAAAGVFAVFALQRHQGARVGFTVAAAAIVLVTPMVADFLPATTLAGFLPVVLLFTAIRLWTRPARDWFAGRPVAEATAAERPRTGRDTDPFAVNRPRHRLDSRLLASENNPQQDESGTDQTAPWPRMPEDGSGQPLPPPTPGFGAPPGQAPAYPGQGGPTAPPPGAGGPAPHDQQGQAGPGHAPQGPPPPPPQAGYPYPQGPYGEQLPYGQPPYGQPYGQQVPYGGYPPHYGQLPYGELPPGQPSGNQPPYGQPYFGARPVDTDRRPATVTVAAWITWILSGLALVGLVITAIAIPSSRDQILRQLEANPGFQQSNLTVDDVIGMVWVMIAISVLWAVAAIVLALFAFRRANWARITLVVSAAMTALLTLFGALANVVLLLGTMGAIAVVAMLFLGGANEWYARRPAFPGYPGSFQPYGQPSYGRPGQPGPWQYGGPQQYGAPPEEPRPYDRTSPGSDPTGGPRAEERPPEQGRAEPSDGRTGGRGKDEPPSNVW